MKSAIKPTLDAVFALSPAARRELTKYLVTNDLPQALPGRDRAEEPVLTP